MFDAKMMIDGVVILFEQFKKVLGEAPKLMKASPLVNTGLVA